MIILIILGVILVIFSILLLMPIKIEIAFDGSLHAAVRLLFFHKSLTEKEQNEESAAEPTEQKKSEKAGSSMKDRLKLFFKREGISGLLSFITDLSEILLHSAKKLLSHVQIRHFHLHICVACGDAYETALLYGKVCTAAAGAYSALFTAKKCKDKTTAVTCDYTQKESTGTFTGTLHIRLFFVVGEALKLLCKALPVLLRFNRVTTPSKTSKST